MSNDEDSLRDRIVAENTQEITAFTDKIAEQSKDMPSSPVFAQSVTPIPGNFRLKEEFFDPKKQAELDTLEKSTLAAHGEENPKDPLVQMAIAQATRSNDISQVNKVLNSNEIDPQEEAALKKVASKIQTDEERDSAVSKMILDQRAKEVEGRFPSAKINPVTGDMIAEEK